MGSPRSRPVVLDAGALIALERGHPRMRALARLAHEQSMPLIVPAGALGQVWRGGARQARVAALVNSSASHVEVLDELTAKASGVLCGRSDTNDLTGASVVLAARTHAATVVTSDLYDLLKIDPSLPAEQI